MSIELNSITNNISQMSMENKCCEPVKTQVTIVNWDQKELPRKSKEIRHLDIGSANYNPDENSHEDYHPTPADKAGEIIHRVLFCEIDHIINTNPKCKNFVFYLVDWASDGLDKAANNLSNYIIVNHASKGIIVRIEKIVSNFFKIEHFPEVDSSSFLNPPDRYLPRIFYPKQPEKDKKVIMLLTKIAKCSRKGLVVREVNMPKFEVGIYDRLLVYKPISNGLIFKNVDTSYLPNYTLPCGKQKEIPGLSYRIKILKTEENKQNSTLRSRTPSKEVMIDPLPSISTPSGVSDTGSSTPSTCTPS